MPTHQAPTFYSPISAGPGEHSRFGLVKRSEGRRASQKRTGIPRKNRAHHQTPLLPCGTPWDRPSICLPKQGSRPSWSDARNRFFSPSAPFFTRIGWRAYAFVATLAAVIFGCHPDRDPNRGTTDQSRFSRGKSAASFQLLKKRLAPCAASPPRKLKDPTSQRLKRNLASGVKVPPPSANRNRGVGKKKPRNKSVAVL